MLVGMRVGKSLSSTPFSGVPPASKMCPGVLGVEPGVVLSKWGGPGVRRALQLGVVAGWREREVRNKGRSRRWVNKKIDLLSAIMCLFSHLTPGLVLPPCSPLPSPPLPSLPLLFSLLPSHVPLVGEGVVRPFLRLVNHVFTLCSVIPSMSPSGPRTIEPLFIAISASLHTRANSTRCSREGNWFCRVGWNQVEPR